MTVYEAAERAQQAVGVTRITDVTSGGTGGRTALLDGFSLEFEDL
jgi:hypothetical protein